VYCSDTKQHRIDYVYEVISVQLVEQKYIKSKQAGVPVKNIDDKYWLFKLGRVTKMELSIDVSGSRDFKIHLVKIDELMKATTWDDLLSHYAFLYE